MNAATTTADRSGEIERYLAGVTVALADLPEKVRQELLEDLPDHLAEIAADDPASLDSRLGPPPAYAAELRAAIGIDATKQKHHADRWAGRWADVMAAVRPHARTVDEKVGRLIGYDRLVDFLVQLRPAWWILRGYIVGMVLLYLFAGGYDIFPQNSSAGLLGWLLVLVLVGVSIRLGRQPLHLVRNVRPRWLAIAGVVLLFVAWSLTLVDVGSDDAYYPPPPSYGDVGNGSEVYVYTDTGLPITDVRVYDRNGRAVPIGVPIGCEQPEFGYAREKRGCVPREDMYWIQSEAPEPGTEPSLRPGLEPSASPSPS